MTIQIGDRLPDAFLMTMTAEGPKKKSVDEIFSGKTAALFAVPGAFTPTCSAKHLPGFRDKAEELRAKGIDLIACVSVNDAFVMSAWGESLNVGDGVLMLADGSADFAEALGLTMDGRDFGMGVRSQRYSMLVRNGVVEQLNIEAPGEYKVSSAEYLLRQI